MIFQFPIKCYLETSSVSPLYPAPFHVLLGSLFMAAATVLVIRRLSFRQVIFHRRRQTYFHDRMDEMSVSSRSSIEYLQG
ncbi:hypothetical protein TGAM01_v208483 [Trichoderma gamsii]|uniref:Uncharacterized protein n=1 Tax=Trichoderma gamsii TaxID=398673 RepID=A0A2P4ZE69_9HYPO|nr:hypothetical protein TGAM01_v208483 [Trichoderma gamsii]PON22594.1 hypothetical protein TGAM01_v208483 [Trichoderma gamsii]